jgi:hypothetical protein
MVNSSRLAFGTKPSSRQGDFGKVKCAHQAAQCNLLMSIMTELTARSPLLRVLAALLMTHLARSVKSPQDTCGLNGPP